MGSCLSKVGKVGVGLGKSEKVKMTITPGAHSRARCVLAGPGSINQSIKHMLSTENLEELAHRVVEKRKLMNK